MNKSVNGAYKFGLFRLETKNNELYRDSTNEKVLALTTRQLQILRFLIENRDKAYTTAYLLNKFWPDKFVEGNNVTQAITDIRKALGEKPGENKYIQTIDKKYRFVADVILVEIRDEQNESAMTAPPETVEAAETEEEIPEPIDREFSNEGENAPLGLENTTGGVPGREAKISDVSEGVVDVTPTEETSKTLEREDIDKKFSGQETNTPKKVNSAGENSRDGFTTFGAWLFGPGRTITLILCVCMALASIVSLTLSSRPIKLSQEFTEDDFSNPRSLLNKLSADHKGPVSSYLCEKNTLAKEKACAASTISDGEMRDILIGVFNKALNDPDLYNDTIFRDVDLNGQVNQHLKDPSRLNRSFLQDAYPIEIKRITNATWGKPAAALMQCFTILIALFYAGKKYWHSGSGNQILGEGVSRSLRIIRNYWFGLFCSWFLLYIFLFFYFSEESFHLSKKIGLSPDAFTLIANFLATTFNYFNTLLIVYCFTYLNEQGEKEEESTKNIFKYLILGLWVLTLSAYFISYLVFKQSKDVSNGLDLFTGVVAGVAMALFIGRLQSKFFGTRPGLLIILYSYTTLQPLYFYLTTNNVQDIWVILLINFYLVLKCLLFLYMAWLFESTRLSFYLVEIREKHKDIESDWENWLNESQSSN